MGWRSKCIRLALSIICIYGWSYGQTGNPSQISCFQNVDLQAQQYGTSLLQKLPRFGNSTVGSYASCSNVLKSYQTEQEVAARSKLKYCMEPSIQNQLSKDFRLTSTSDTIHLKDPIRFIGKPHGAIKKYVADQMKITLGIFKGYAEKSPGIYEYEPIDFTGSMSSMAEETNQSYYTLSSLVGILPSISVDYQHPCWSKVYAVRSVHLPESETMAGVAYGSDYNGDAVVIATQYQEFYAQDRSPLHGTRNNWLQAWYLDTRRTSFIGSDDTSLIKISSVTIKNLEDPHVRGYTMDTDTGAFYVGFRDYRVLVKGM